MGRPFYETRVAPIERPEWGFITAKPGKLFLHVVNPPANNVLLLKGLSANVSKAYPLAGRENVLNTNSKEEGLEIELQTGWQIGDLPKVMVMEYEGELCLHS